MKVTAFTRATLASRRQSKELFAKGWEEVGEGGGKLWELHRGYRHDYRIVAVQIGADGKRLYVKIEKA